MTLITPSGCFTRRTRLGLSQTALSTKAELRPNYVCRFEGGAIREPSGEKLVRIEAALLKAEVEMRQALSQDHSSGGPR